MMKWTARVRFNQEAAKRKILADRVAGLKRLAEFVADEARILAPVDEGELRDSIHVVSSSDGLHNWVVAPVDHAEPQEFGFVHYISGAFIPPQAYMRRALRKGAERFPEYVGGATVKQGFHHSRLMGIEFSV
jgi:hypothetical protein